MVNAGCPPRPEQWHKQPNPIRKPQQTSNSEQEGGKPEKKKTREDTQEPGYHRKLIRKRHHKAELTREMNKFKTHQTLSHNAQLGQINKKHTQKKLQKEKEKQTKSIQDKDNRIKDLQETNE